MSGKLRANLGAGDSLSRGSGTQNGSAPQPSCAKGVGAATGSGEAKGSSTSRWSASELAKRPLAYPKECIYNYFMAHEGALLAITVVGVVAGVLLLVWFLAFSGMNEPVQFIYDSF